MTLLKFYIYFKLVEDLEPPDAVPTQRSSDVAALGPRNSQSILSQCHRYKTLCMDVMVSAIGC